MGQGDGGGDDDDDDDVDDDGTDDADDVADAGAACEHCGDCLIFFCDRVMVSETDEGMDDDDDDEEDKVVDNDNDDDGGDASSCHVESACCSLEGTATALDLTANFMYCTLFNSCSSTACMRCQEKVAQRRYKRGVPQRDSATVQMEGLRVICRVYRR